MSLITSFDTTEGQFGISATLPFGNPLGRGRIPPADALHVGDPAESGRNLRLWHWWTAIPKRSC